MPRNWRLTFASALLFVLAFNVTFFIQELFLVLPKAIGLSWPGRSFLLTSVCILNL